MGGRLFRVLLMLLPAEFRSDYGREMEATFKAEAAEARGAVGLRLWMATIADLLRTAPAEHLDILVRDLRKREIGIRLALGAAAGEIRRMIVSQGMRPAAAGLVVGLAVALGSADALRALLYRIDARDALPFAAATLVIGAAVLVACLVPATKATRVDPAAAIRDRRAACPTRSRAVAGAT